MAEVSLDTYDHDALQQVIEFYDAYSRSIPSDLILLLTGAREGIHIAAGYTDGQSITDHPIQGVLDDLGLPHTRRLTNERIHHDAESATAPTTPDGAQRLLEATETERDNLAKLEYYVARDPDRLLTYPPTIRRYFPHFLGYPEHAIEAKENGDIPFFESFPLKEFIDEGHITREDARYLALPHYAIPHTVNDANEKIQRGRTYYAAFERFDEYMGTTAATDAADERIEESLNHYDL